MDNLPLRLEVLLIKQIQVLLKYFVEHFHHRHGHGVGSWSED